MDEMIQSFDHIGTNYTSSSLNNNNENNNILIKEANELCEEIGDLVDSLYNNLTTQEYVEYNNGSFDSNSCNCGNNRCMSNTRSYANSNNYDVFANELIRKQVEKEKLVYCNDKLNEIKGLLENFKDPDQTIKKNGMAWEIDENYLQQFQLKLNIQNQQELIKEKLNQADKLKLSDYYNIHFNKSRSNTTPGSKIVNNNIQVSNRLKTSPWSNAMNNNSSPLTRFRSTNVNNMGTNGHINSMNNVSNCNPNTCKIFSPNHLNLQSKLNGTINSNRHNFYNNSEMRNLSHVNMVGRFNKERDMVYVKGTMKLNPKTLQNNFIGPNFDKFNANKYSNLVMNRDRMDVVDGVKVSYSCNSGYETTTVPSSDFTRLKHSNTASMCDRNICYGDNSSVGFSGIEGMDVVQGYGGSGLAKASSIKTVVRDANNGLVGGGSMGENGTNGMEIGSNFDYRDENVNSLKKDDPEYYEFETIDDLMKYQNDEYYCKSMGPLPQLTSNNDKLIDKLFEGNEPRGGNTPLAMPCMRDGATDTPINTLDTTNPNSENTTNNGMDNTNSHFDTDNIIGSGRETGTFGNQERSLGYETDGTIDQGNNRDEKLCKHFYLYKIYNNRCSNGKRSNRIKRRHHHHRHHHHVRENEYQASSDAENNSLENSTNNTNVFPGTNCAKPQREVAESVDNILYRTRVICPNL